MQPEDPYRRPSGAEGPRYEGPPPTTAPPPGWQPEVVIEPPPPRTLPPQDHFAIDDDEARARTFTRGLSLVVSAILLVVALVVCGQRLL